MEGQKGGLSIQYESLEEAERRLAGTIVMYDGEPVYIHRVVSAAPGDPKPDIFRVYAIPLPTRIAAGGRVDDEPFRRFISSRKFDFQTIPMGFMNTDGNLYYCCRLPQRQQKQGVCGATLQCNEVIGNRGEGYRLGSLLAMPSFADMIRGAYPSFKATMDMIREPKTFGVAFDRQYALVKDADIDGLVYIYYKHNKVGFLMDDKITLSSKMKCLKESLAELGLRL